VVLIPSLLVVLCSLRPRCPDSSSDVQQNEITEEANSTDEDLQAQLEQNLQFHQEMHAFEHRLERHDEWWADQIAEAADRAQAEKSAEREAAVRVMSQSLVDSDMEGNDSGEESSGLSTVSSSRFEGLDDSWWKESSDSEVVAVRLRSQGNA
jgi:hypothetical protein